MNFRYKKHPEFQDSTKTTFINSIFYNVKCGELLIKEMDYFNSQISVISSSGELKLKTTDVFYQAKKWDNRGIPYVESKYKIIYDGEVFLKNGKNR